MGGTIVVCDINCKTCSGATSSDCTSCYYGKALAGGICGSCTDTNAVSCLETDAGYSTSCIPGFTSAFYTDSTGTKQQGGTCRACSLFCLKCDQNGPGNCDSGNCIAGYAQLINTVNCTACFGGCPKCSPTNPSFCEQCPAGQYGANGVCTACMSTCATCADGTSCATCITGSSLINSTCYVVPSGCTGLSSATGQCSACFSGYTLSGNTCTVDTTCNGTSTCTVCQSGFYLSSGKCLNCPTLLSNCITCDATTTSNCFLCSTGFYLAGGGTACTACTTGCADCASPSFCKAPSAGYYLIPTPEGQNSGQFAACTSPCATCMGDAKRCTSCIPNYSLNGTSCLNDNQVSLNLVLGSSGSAPVISATATPEEALAAGLTQIDRIRTSICGNLPPEYGSPSGSGCYDVVIFVSIAGGSLSVGTVLAGGSFSSPTAATSSIGSSFGSGAPLDGLSVLSSTSAASGFTASNTATSSSSSTNLGLILGLTIPLVLLRTSFLTQLF